MLGPPYPQDIDSPYGFGHCWEGVFFFLTAKGMLTYPVTLGVTGSSTYHLRVKGTTT